jgi:hypothetical protein
MDDFPVHDMDKVDEPSTQLMFGSRMFNVLGSDWWTPLMLAFGLIVLVGMYIYLHRDARRRSLEDDQIGIKAALLVLLMIALGQLCLGLVDLFHFVLAKAGSDAKKMMPAAQAKSAVGPLLAGLALFGLSFGLLQKTNYRQFTKASRLTLGFIGFQYAVWGALALGGLVSGVLTKVPWIIGSRQLAILLITTPIGVLTLMMLGRLSGWSRGAPMPAAPPAPPPGYPPQYPPGYPPGYPPPPSGS